MKLLMFSRPWISVNGADGRLRGGAEDLAEVAEGVGPPGRLAEQLGALDTEGHDDLGLDRGRVDREEQPA